MADAIPRRLDAALGWMARAAAGFMLAWTGPAAAAPAGRPNVLLVVSEDNGPDLGCYGAPSVRTPHLDRLAAEGVRFDRAWVTQAGCSPSRASFLTGLHPHQHGQLGLATWGFRMFRDDAPNLVRSLLPLLAGGRPEWRGALFAEYHTHAAAANCYP